MKQKSNTLTKAEFDVMSTLWDINHSATVHDILEHFAEPKPAYTTVATYMKLLLEKGYVDYFKVKGEGKTKIYQAKVTRAEYTRQAMAGVKKDFFGGSLRSLLNFFVKEENLSDEEIADLLSTINNEQASVSIEEEKTL
ncbi:MULTISPECIES: BlaI/MecI/CopY family transcriptional regulator [Prevotella]|uniref:Transcriptional regulator n=1 Tax=Prevotella herbatica TaxID=2801997 RepID=A0ABM7NW20_9BACT|nr:MULTISPECIES: BlaI/MecI/CopY family transcriptional regulator [Prevotella]MDN5553340.1 BlaI/MecI/CopY family transcriptional regulator [Prevotella sp.]BCS84682.1 transcriptional regulator [Prevotella herbatica]